MLRLESGILLLLAVYAAASCGGEAGVTPARIAPEGERGFLPRLTNDLLPAPLAGLVPGSSTTEDVLAVFPELKSEIDDSLGGTGTVAYNGHPAVVLRLPRKAEPGPRARPDGIEELTFYLVPDGAGVPRVHSMSLVQDPRGGETLCEWLHRVIGADPESLKGPDSNLSLGHTGKSPDAGVYCIGTPDGKAGILVEGRSTSRGFGEIEYDLLGSGAPR